ncbi:hypothetical protein [Bdellovibrio sp. ZAP7]|uniref:hypothetical protein n=1 Tax=Bdellovibrio sp. ZAP7 TaxID=2231053 RepID=UPI001158D9DF|nr:hypothetical protein [Bdellovibrio sp. ZAP7]
MNSFDWVSLHFACCFYLTGVILVIHLTHYPAFSFIAEKDFAKFHARHTAVMGGIVGPVMILELLTALILCHSYSLNWLFNLAGVVIIWLSTFLWSVPSHARLSRGQDLAEIKKLVRGNWLRTVIWTARSALFLLLILKTKIFL